MQKITHRTIPQGKVVTAAPLTNRLYAIIIIAAVFLVFSQTLRHEFVWDDLRSHLERNEAVQKNDLRKIWNSPYDGMYIPVTYSIWSVLAHVDTQGSEKLRPLPFHLLNVATHALNGILVFLLLLHLFRHSHAALAGALMFALHPLQVESVSWISEFRGLLATFFSLLALLTVFRDSKKAARTGIAATIFFLLAILSKPSAVILPLCVPIIAWTFFPDSLKRNSLLSLLWVLLAIPVMLVTSTEQSTELQPFLTPPLQRPLVAGFSYFFYLTKLVMPLKLSACYGKTPDLVVHDPWTLLYAIVMVVATGMIAWRWKQNRILASSWLLFIVVLLPVSGLITFTYQRTSTVADRYMYFAMLALAICIAALWKRNHKPAVPYLVSVLILVFAFLSFKQTRTWKDESAMWENSLQQYPEQFTAAYNLGVIRQKENKLEEAVRHYSTALEYRRDKNTFSNRANAYAKSGHFREALIDYSEALKLDQRDGSIYYNRAITFYILKNYEAAAKDLEIAVRLRFPVDPELSRAINRNLARRSRRARY